MTDSIKRFSEGDVVFFVDDYKLPGNPSGDGQVHRAVTAEEVMETVFKIGSREVLTGIQLAVER